MTSKELNKIGEALFGKWWRDPLAEELGISERTMRRYANGETAISDKILPDLRNVIKRRGSALVKMADELEEV